MISTHALSSSGGTARYFEEAWAPSLSSAEYYAKELTPSAWGGRSAGFAGFDLKQSIAVAKADFVDALNGRMRTPSGEIVELGRFGKNPETGKKEWQHRPGIDLTFAPPKSVSIVGIIGQSAEMRAAHEASVATAMQYLEANAGIVRHSLPGGGKEHVNVGSLLYATFAHGISRENDPQIHTHVVLINAVWDETTGKWRSLANEEMLKLVRAADAVYTSTLANHLTAMGHELKWNDKGSFEIAAVSKNAIDAFSSRNLDAKAWAKGQGLDWEKLSRVEKTKIILDLRKDKTAPTRGELFSQWEAKVPGIREQVGNILAAAHARATQITDKLSADVENKLATKAVGQAIRHISESEVRFRPQDLLVKALDFARDRVSPDAIQSAIDRALTTGSLVAGSGKPVTPTQPKPLIFRKDFKHDETRTNYAALRTIGQSIRTFAVAGGAGGQEPPKSLASVRHLSDVPLVQRSGGASVLLQRDTRADLGADRQASNGVRRQDSGPASDKGQAGQGRVSGAAPYGVTYTTPAAIKAEQDMVHFIVNGKNAVTPFLTRAQAEKALDAAFEARARIAAETGDVAYQLNAGQRSAAIMALTSPDRHNATVGKAGTGKTTMLLDLHHALRNHVIKPSGMSSGGAQTDTLAKETKIESHVIAKILIQQEQLDRRAQAILDKRALEAKTRLPGGAGRVHKTSPIAGTKYVDLGLGNGVVRTNMARSGIGMAAGIVAGSASKRAVADLRAKQSAAEDGGKLAVSAQLKAGLNSALATGSKLAGRVTSRYEKAGTIESFLVRREMSAKDAVQRKLDDAVLREYYGQDGKKLWIVDEASMTSQQEFTKLLEYAERRNASVLFVGDPSQHQSPAGGNSFGQALLAGMRRALMTEIHRQHDTVGQDVVRAMLNDFKAAQAGDTLTVGHTRSMGKASAGDKAWERIEAAALNERTGEVYRLGPKEGQAEWKKGETLTISKASTDAITVTRKDGTTAEQSGGFLAAYNKLPKVEIADTEKLIARIASDLVHGTGKTEGVNPLMHDTIIVTATNSDRAKINDAVRAELKASGQLSGEDHTFATLGRKSLSKEEQKVAEKYKVGDVLVSKRDYYIASLSGVKEGDVLRVTKVNATHRNADAHTLTVTNERTGKQHVVNPGKTSNFDQFTAKESSIVVNDKIRFTKGFKDADGENIRNGWTGVVKEIKGDILTVDVRTATGTKTVELDTNKQKHWEVGYAKTSYAAQGATEKLASHFVNIEKSVTNLREAYVAWTRAKGDAKTEMVGTTVYTQDVAKAEKLVTKDAHNSVAMLDIKAYAAEYAASKATLVEKAGEVLSKAQEALQSLYGKVTGKSLDKAQDVAKEPVTDLREMVAAAKQDRAETATVEPKAEAKAPATKVETPAAAVADRSTATKAVEKARPVQSPAAEPKVEQAPSKGRGR